MLTRRTLISGGLALSAATALAATGCSPTSSGASGSTSETLVVYSNSIADGRGAWLADQAKAAGFNLQFVDLGGGDVMNRLIQEKNNPVADVTFGLNNVFFEKIKAAGALQDYKPAWADKVDAGLGDGAQFWPIVREPIMLVYNLGTYPGGTGAPADWPDLWNKAEFHGKYETPTGLGGATTQMVVSGILSRFRDANGTLGISAEGWKNIGDYFKNGSPAVKGEDLYARMKAGKVNAGQMWLAGKVTREKQYDIKTDAAHPTVGVPMVVQQVALVKGTKKADTAKKFIDWFGAADLQGKWSEQFKTAPTNKDAKGDADAVKMTDSFTRQDIDWTFVANSIDKWVEKIELEYLGK